MDAQKDITGLILAGGQGRRMGGVDKGLQLFQGQALALHALHRLQPQVGACMINANRSLAQYAVFGVPVYSDVLPDFAGPLAGLVTGLAQCTSEWLLTVPCDSPCFPLDLAQRMRASAAKEKARVVLAAGPQVSGDDRAWQVRPQPVFTLVHRSLLPSLQHFVAQGGRKIIAWTEPHGHALCRFDLPSDDPHAFVNVNTMQELLQLQAQIPMPMPMPMPMPKNAS